eukprot:m.264400 g.264400  ORF g.264400 m.264400 type:complete len:107 (+) comp40469_c0_seq74:109-429(+)
MAGKSCTGKDSNDQKLIENWDLGPVYGFQWRHFGAEYVNMRTDYSGKGVDQLANVIHKIKTNPEDRRIIMCAWNPADMHLMALPPYNVSVLCERWRAVMSNVPEIS